ncbi:30602_t:CDS:1, partial [Racocetra persica]
IETETIEAKKASVARSVRINTNISTRVAGNSTTTKGKNNAGTRISSNVIDLESSVEYESDSLSSDISEVDYDSQGD